MKDRVPGVTSVVRVDDIEASAVPD